MLKIGLVRNLVLAVAALALLSVGGSARAQQNSQQLYVVTYIDVFPQFAAATTAALKQFAADSLKDAGAVRFEIYKDVERTNHFSVVEVWRDRAAYEAHLQQPHSKQFREKIQPGMGSPFDERLYNMVP